MALHAHWNLDRGGSIAALLSACRKALIHVREKNHGSCPKPGSSSCTPTATTRDDDVVDVVVDDDHCALGDHEALLDSFRQKVIRVASSADQAENVGIALEGGLEFLEQFSSKATDDGPSFSTGLRPAGGGVTLKEDIGEVIRCGRRCRSWKRSSNLGSGTDDGEDCGASSVVQADVASVVLCLAMLGVKSVSYAPLPLQSDATPYQVERFVGLNVTPVSSTTSASQNPQYDDGTILFLQLLTKGTLKGLSWKESPPPAMKLVWQGTGVGVGSDDVDGGTNNHGTTNVECPRVTLTLGTATTTRSTAAAPNSLDKNSSLGFANPYPSTTAATSSGTPWNVDRLVRLQTNVDDLTPEHCAFVMELLMSPQEGGGDGGGGGALALDAWTTPIGMKKGRSTAQQLSVLCTHDNKDDAMRVLFRHARTLGIRQQFVDRASLRRRIVTVELIWKGENANDPGHRGRVDVKLGYMLTSNNEDEIVSIKPEFDHCRAIAMATGAPIQSIAEQAMLLAKQKMERGCYC